jgi:hypothetical protein
MKPATSHHLLEKFAQALSRGRASGGTLRRRWYGLASLAEGNGFAGLQTVGRYGATAITEHGTEAADVMRFG